MEETYSKWPKWQKVYVLCKNSDPKGLSAPALGLYTCIKTWKIMYKIRLQRYFFFKLANNGQSDKVFLLTSGFCPQRIVCPCPGTIYMRKNIKKSKFKEICLKLATNGWSDKGFLLTSKVCPQRFSALAPGLYTCIKSSKMCIKSDFEEIILKLAIYGQREKAFLLSSKFCHQFVVCLCPGLCTCGKTWKKNVFKIKTSKWLF